MLKKTTLYLMLVSSILLFTACGGDNAYDGENGLISATAESGAEAFASIQENVLLPEAENLQTTLKTLQSAVSTLETNTTSTNLTVAQNAFKDSALSWKRVQATLIAPDFNSSFLDTSNLIDHFHVGNEDIPTLIENALAKTTDLNTLLYKNSTKGFTALEYLLFGEGNTTAVMLTSMQKDDKRRIEATQISISNLITQTAPIVHFYKNDSTFQSDVKEASDSLLNVLIDSSYKLKEWRVGDAAGLTVKYKNELDLRRLEYYRSNYSLEGISAIVDEHAKIVNTQSFANFATFANENSASKEVQEVMGYIKTAQEIIASFDKTLEESVSDEKMNTLYQALVNLHNGYYLSLINALNITSKIIEADGD